MPRLSELEAIYARKREREAGGGRLIPLRMDFEHNGETILSAGGQWDKRLEDFEGETTRAVVVRMHDGQRKAVEWFARWLTAHHDRRDHPPKFTLTELEAFELDVDPDHVYSALFAGGRRGGKTWIAVAFAVCYAIMFPDAIVWIVSPNDQKHDEIRRYLNDFIAHEWLDIQTLWAYEFINGSVIYLKSAHGTGGGLKEGKADLVILNEGQMMQSRAYTVARGAIVDSSGIVIVCANPPVESKDQQWVSDFAADSAAGRRASVFLEFNPLLNPHIDRVALLALRSEVDERTFQIEVLGMFRGPADAVAYNWIRIDNERRPPMIPDVTSAFLTYLEEGDGIQAVAGVDFQRFPHIGGPIYKFYGNVDRDRVLAWIVDEVVLPGGDEEDYCAALREKGYDPDTLLIVGDASGQYQHTRRRNFEQAPLTWTGRGSFDIIKGAGFWRIVPPDRRMKRNPAIVDRVRAFTSMICSGIGLRRLFCDPIAAPKTAAAIRDWRQVHGVPSRTQEPAHIGDGASYPIVRLFPRRLRSDKTSGVDPVASLVDLAALVGPAPRILPPLHSASSFRRGSRIRGM